MLRELVARGAVGWRLLDLASQCGLEHATAHRILAALVRERLAHQRPDRRYVAGPLVFELGVSSRAYVAFQAACVEPVATLARHWDSVVIVSARSGTDFVCLAREGRPLAAMTIEVGTRRPLITSVSGVAIVVDLPSAESRALVADNFRRLGRFGEARRRDLRAMIQRSREAGFGISLEHVVPGIGAIGVAMRDAHGRPFASVALVAPVAQLTESRIGRIVTGLRATARALEPLAPPEIA